LSLPIYNQEARGFNNIFNRIAKGFHILAKRFELNFFTRKTVLYRIKPGRKKSSSQPVILPIAQPFKKPLGKHCKSKVSCPRTQHNNSNKVCTKTTRYGVQYMGKPLVPCI